MQHLFFSRNNFPVRNAYFPRPRYPRHIVSRRLRPPGKKVMYHAWHLRRNIFLKRPLQRSMNPGTTVTLHLYICMLFLALINGHLANGTLPPTSPRLPFFAAERTYLLTKGQTHRTQLESKSYKKVNLLHFDTLSCKMLR